jgi:hypothetical protein
MKTIALVLFILLALVVKSNAQTGKFTILLTPQNGFYMEDTLGFSSKGFLRNVVEYQTTKSGGVPAGKWKNGSLAFEYQHPSLPGDLTYSNMQLITDYKEDMKLRVTVNIHAIDSGIVNEYVYSLGDGKGDSSTISLNDQTIDTCVVLETQTQNKSASFFFSAAEKNGGNTPYYVFSVFIEEL